jgi:pathogenesis-related protein 1
VVWRGSNEIGCGVSSCPLFGTTGLLWVCNYDPPGNIIGQRPY